MRVPEIVDGRCPIPGAIVLGEERGLRYDVGVTRIYLTGFMGSGKTTVGRTLASALGIRFVDLDEWIVRSLGASIAEVFARRGEVVFRDEEQRQLELTTRLDRAVVATGGGTYCFEANRELIRRSGGVSVFLELPWGVLLARLPGKNADRPKFGDPETARRLYEERLPAYRQADVVLRLAGDERPADVARKVLERVGEAACVS